jgi:signal transduction histidine kinase
MGLVARWRASTFIQDIVTAGATFLLGLALNLMGFTGTWLDLEAGRFAGLPEWWHTVFLTIGCAAMLVKRSYPVIALLTGVAAVAADAAFGGSIGLILVLCDLLFSAGLFASVRARTTIMTVVVVVIGTSSIVAGLAQANPRVTVSIALQLTGLLVVPLWWAANLRQQRELGAVNAERARRDAVSGERSAMARELHDVIASHLSTTAIHSAAALALPPDQERDRAALRAVRVSSLAALEEMRSMIMLLRSESGDPRAEALVPAGLGQLPELAETARATGLEVAVDNTAPAEIPALVDHTSYRIVHEALTNAGKHAPGSRVRIAIAEAGGELTVAVTNTLTQPVHFGHHSLSAGTGLPGMKERAALLGGHVTAGNEGGLWRVVARLPLPVRS